MKKLLFSVAIAICGAGGALADCGEVQIKASDWQSAIVNETVTRFILEQGYGCTVKMVPLDTQSSIVSLAENGTPDIVPEMWENSAGALTGMRDDGRILFHNKVLSDGGQQGWWVPQYLVDEHPQLATLEGILANPDLVGNRFFSCPEGWTCNFTNAHMAQAAGFEEAGIEVFVPGSGQTLATSLQADYADRKPWFGYYWAPTPLLGENPMVLVDVGPYDEAAFACNASDECADPKMSAYPSDNVWTIVTATFAEREPEVVEMLGKMSFTNREMGAVLAWQNQNDASAEEAAVYFLTNYQDVWSGWLNDAAREKLSALLQ